MESDLAWIARVTGARGVTRGPTIQSLWGGYGEVFRVQLEGAASRTAIVKAVSPPARARGGADRSHARKCRSYEVETAWYRDYASLCGDACRVPRLLGSRAGAEAWVFVLEDLDGAGYSARRSRLEPSEVEECLRWLASFHARFMGRSATGLWSTGTYWHLATRPDELDQIEDRALRDAAPVLDRVLREARFQTFVHGDAKVANFCFAPSAPAVAAVDFQYVGGGPGVKDVAYFLSSCSRRGAEADDPRYLGAYFSYLRAAILRQDGTPDRGSFADAVEVEWRALYPIACADFARFFAGWAKEQYRFDEVGQRVVRDVLLTL